MAKADRIGSEVWSKTRGTLVKKVILALVGDR